MLATLAVRSSKARGTVDASLADRVTSARVAQCSMSRPRSKGSSPKKTRPMSSVTATAIVAKSWGRATTQALFHSQRTARWTLSRRQWQSTRRTMGRQQPADCTVTTLLSTLRTWKAAAPATPNSEPSTTTIKVLALRFKTKMASNKS